MKLWEAVRQLKSIWRDDVELVCSVKLHRGQLAAMWEVHVGHRIYQDPSLQEAVMAAVEDNEDMVQRLAVSRLAETIGGGV